MSVLAYPPSNDDEIIRYCTKKCGYITSTEDQQFFALGCMFCPVKFLYFDAYIGHIQREHGVHGNMTGNESYNGGRNNIYGGKDQMCYDSGECMKNEYGNSGNEYDEMGDSDAALLVSQMVMVKQEIPDEETNGVFPNATAIASDGSNQNNGYNNEEQNQQAIPKMSTGEANYYGNNAYVKNEDISGDGYFDEDQDGDCSDDYDEDNYDEMVEESLVKASDDSGLAQHIKDRKMISFVIDAYRRNPYLWDHRNPHFRDRKRRQQFLEWMLAEFKRRFNVSLARDAVTRKWDNLRTVYKRECNRMALERTNVSTLWYFKELDFLSQLYGGPKTTTEEAVKVQESVHRRRYSALWNDSSTNRLLQMMRSYPCFYDRNNLDYRNKDKRGEALQVIANELQKIIDVTTIQISKRVSQLRFDYSKQKHERFQCELLNKAFIPTYSYYQQMFFMDADIAPFKCDFCGLILPTSRDEETHIVLHQTPNLNGYICPECEAVFPDVEQFKRHKQSQHPTPPLAPPLPPSLKEPKYFCDLCSANFREKSNYDEHMRRHNDELLLPGLANVNFEHSDILSDTNAPPLPPPPPISDAIASKQMTPSPAISSKLDRPFICDMCGKSFTSAAYLAAHLKTHVGSVGSGNGERSFRCDYANCGRSFLLRESYVEHMRSHYSFEGATCNICGKTFKSAKNLQNHKQIHDVVKRYVCKICGSAFAQAAGLYLHKRRHLKNADGAVDKHRGRQSY